MGFPTKELLNQLQQFEIQLESPTAIRLMSRTGEGTREAVFQVKNKGEFTKLVPAKAKNMAAECAVESEDDPTWSLWESTMKRFANANAK